MFFHATILAIENDLAKALSKEKMITVAGSSSTLSSNKNKLSNSQSLIQSFQLCEKN
jgi:hypothetical protein